MSSRTFALVALLAAAPTALAQPADPPGRADERSPLLRAHAALEEELRQRRTEAAGRAEAFDAFLATLRARSAAFVRAWGDRAQTAEEHLVIARLARTADDVARQLVHLDRVLASAGPKEALHRQAAAWSRCHALLALGRHDEAGDALAAFRREFPGARQLRRADRLAQRIASVKGRAALVGKPAPALRVERVVGLEPGESAEDAPALTLEGLRGKVVLLDFFATWCDPCRRSIPALAELQRARRSDGLVVVGVTRLYGAAWLAGKLHRGVKPEEELALTRRFRGLMAIDYPIAYCPKAYEPYHVASIPTLVLIDRAGNVAASYAGPGAVGRLKEAIEGALSTRPPAGTPAGPPSGD